MKKFDYITIKKLLDENSDFLLNARVQKIQQPTRQELIFTLRNKNLGRKLYVNINPNLFHMCFMSKENEAKRFIKIPKAPPMFCMLLRKYLEGAKIAKISQPKQERIVEFYFETFNELNDRIYLCLAIELMGKHSNVILYNYDTNVILGSMHNVGAEKSREREVMGGLPYTYPPKSSAKKFSGFSELIPEDVSANDFIDNSFAKLQSDLKFDSIKSKLFNIVDAKLRKIDNTLTKINSQNNLKQKAENYKKKADLIMANLFHLKDFSSNIVLQDYETNSPIEIKLNETKTIKENANKFYSLYNKSKTAQLKTAQLLEDLINDREYYEQIAYTIENVVDTDDLIEIEAELLPERNQSERLNESKPLFFEIDGFKVYVGKNNRQNDYIVSKLARKNDYWFHVHNCPGSHVLLRLEAADKINDKIIFECAKLAKKYSGAKNSSKVGVIYTEAKNLKKPPKSNLGYVIYKCEKEIIVD